MTNAVIIWFVFTILVCCFIAIIMDGNTMKKKDARIEELENENQSLKLMVFEYQIQSKFEEHSKYYEEL